jgi:hypothetical protein
MFLSLIISGIQQLIKLSHKLLIPCGAVSSPSLNHPTKGASRLVEVPIQRSYLIVSLPYFCIICVFIGS